MTRFEREMRKALKELQGAYEDVAADNPDLEAGWELDLARSVLLDYRADVRAEILRCEFGVVEAPPRPVKLVMPMTPAQLARIQERRARYADRYHR